MEMEMEIYLFIFFLNLLLFLCMYSYIFFFLEICRVLKKSIFLKRLSLQLFSSEEHATPLRDSTENNFIEQKSVGSTIIY